MLGPRILKPNEQVPEIMINGKVVHIYEQKFDSGIEEVVECVDNPHDTGQTILGNENKKRSERKSGMQKLKQRIERERDDDIKRGLRIGNIVKILY